MFGDDGYISDPIVEDLTSRNENNDIATEENCSHVTNETEPTASNILQVLSPVPQKVQKIKRRSKKQHSQILTATPLKTQLEDKERKRRLKEEGKTKKEQESK